VTQHSTTCGPPIRQSVRHPLCPRHTSGFSKDLADGAFSTPMLNLDLIWATQQQKCVEVEQ